MEKYTSDETAWEIAFVLPNLHLEQDEAEEPQQSTIDLGCKDIAIVSPRDERVQAFVRRFPQAGLLLRSFTDEHGTTIDPSVLILREAAAERMKRQIGPLVSFRNAAAAAHLLFGRARAINGNAWSVAIWSDTFDFHPASISLTGDLTVITPAVLSVGFDAEKYTACPSPGIPRVGPRLFGDGYLVRVLGKAWERRFARHRRDEAFGRVLFRSLELAYVASATPLKNQASLHDLGTLVALWINALEVLAHPRKRDVRQTDVLTLVAKYQWESPRLTALRYRIRLGKKKINGNAIQRAANQLYIARNRFLHGEPVDENLLQPVLGKQRVSALQIAPIVYRAALEGYLIERYPRTDFLSRAADAAFELFLRREYEQAVLRLMGYADVADRRRGRQRRA